jgi:hypothetical protein
LATAFLTAFGALWLILEPAGLFLPDTFKWGWPGYLCLVAAGLVIALYHVRPRDKVSRSLPPTDVTVAIQVGDVLAQSGNIVVGATDTFDTQFDDEVISRTSVQGQLLERVFQGDRGELDRLIENALPPDAGTHDRSKIFGKSMRYPVGTVVVVRKGGSRYFLPAFTRMSPALPAYVESTIEELELALASVWRVVNEAGQREPVHVPIIGSHLARLGVSRTLLTQLIILTFIAATLKGGPPSLTVWIANADRDIVDMVALDEWLRGLCAA